MIRNLTAIEKFSSNCACLFIACYPFFCKLKPSTSRNFRQKIPFFLYFPDIQRHLQSFVVPCSSLATIPLKNKIIYY